MRGESNTQVDEVAYSFGILCFRGTDCSAKHFNEIEHLLSDFFFFLGRINLVDSLFYTSRGQK